MAIYKQFFQNLEILNPNQAEGKGMARGGIHRLDICVIILQHAQVSLRDFPGYSI